MNLSSNNDEHRREPTKYPSTIQEGQDIFGNDYLREEDEMADFIDDEEVVDENVLPMGRKK